MNQPNYYDYLQWLEQQKMQMNQPMQMNQQAANQPVLSYVANRTAADLFNVMPGQTAILVDIDSPFVYRKERQQDNTLLPLRVYDLVPHVEKEPVVADMKGYVRREDLDRIISEEVEKRMAEVFARPKREEN
jgi:hypothetical protein